MSWSKGAVPGAPGAGGRRRGDGAVARRPGPGPARDDPRAPTACGRGRGRRARGFEGAVATRSAPAKRSGPGGVAFSRRSSSSARRPSYRRPWRGCRASSPEPRVEANERARGGARAGPSRGAGTPRAFAGPRERAGPRSGAGRTRSGATRRATRSTREATREATRDRAPRREPRQGPPPWRSSERRGAPLAGNRARGGDGRGAERRGPKAPRGAAVLAPPDARRTTRADGGTARGDDKTSRARRAAGTGRALGEPSVETVERERRDRQTRGWRAGRASGRARRRRGDVGSADACDVAYPSRRGASAQLFRAAGRTATARCARARSSFTSSLLLKIRKPVTKRSVEVYWYVIISRRPSLVSAVARRNGCPRRRRRRRSPGVLDAPRRRRAGALPSTDVHADLRRPVLPAEDPRDRAAPPRPSPRARRRRRRLLPLLLRRRLPLRSRPRSIWVRARSESRTRPRRRTHPDPRRLTPPPPREGVSRGPRGPARVSATSPRRRGSRVSRNPSRNRPRVRLRRFAPLLRLR